MLSEVEISEILRLKETGLTPYSIAKTIGRDPKTVASYLGSLGNSEREGSKVPPANEKKGRASRFDFKAKPPDDLLAMVSEEEKMRARANLQEEKNRFESAQAKERQREKIQIAKYEALPPEMAEFFPAYFMSQIYQTIERTFNEMDITNFSLDELILHATAIRDAIISQHKEEIRSFFENGVYSMLKRQVIQIYKLLHQGYVDNGGQLKFEDYLCSIFSRLPPEDQVYIFSIIEM